MMTLKTATAVAAVLVQLAAAGTATTQTLVPRWSNTSFAAELGSGNIVGSASKPWLYVPAVPGFFVLHNETGDTIPLSAAAEEGLLEAFSSSNVVVSPHGVGDDEVLYAASMSAAALNASTLELLWQTSPPTTFTNQSEVYISALPLALPTCGVVLFQGLNHIDGLNASNGNRVWRHLSGPSDTIIPSFGLSRGSIAIDDRRVAIGNYAGYATAIDGCTGIVQWTRRTGLHCDATARYDATTDLVFVACEDHPGKSRIVALHASNGTEAWRSAEAPYVSGLGARGGFLYTQSEQEVAALYATNGTQLWRAVSFSYNAHIVVTDEFVITADVMVSPTANVVVLKRSSGERVSTWTGTTTQPTAQFADSIGVSLDERTLYLGSPVGVVALALPSMP